VFVVAIDYEYTNKVPAGAAMKLIQAAVCATLISTGGVAFATGKCADDLDDRSPDQVLQAHFAAVLSGNVDRVTCDYAKHASIVVPGAVMTGKAAIGAYYTQIFALMGGPGTLAVVSLTTVPTRRDGGVALLEWTLESPHLAVGDGTDTFVIQDGRIQQQTVKLGGLVVR
jgi:hypothetical protein